MQKHELESAILGAIKELRQANEELSRLSKEYALSDHAYRRAKAIAYLATSGTVAERSAHVDKACEEERQRAHLSEAVREAMKERVRSLMTEITAYQTLASLMKAEMGLER